MTGEEGSKGRVWLESTRKKAVTFQPVAIIIRTAHKERGKQYQGEWREQLTVMALGHQQIADATKSPF